MAGHRTGVAEAEIDVLTPADVREAAAAGIGHEQREAPRPLRHPVHRHAGEKVLTGPRGELERARMLVGEPLLLARVESDETVAAHVRRMETIFARHEPRGAGTSTTSPTPAPISA